MTGTGIDGLEHDMVLTDLKNAAALPDPERTAEIKAATKRAGELLETTQPEVIALVAMIAEDGVRMAILSVLDPDHSRNTPTPREALLQTMRDAIGEMSPSGPERTKLTVFEHIVSEALAGGITTEEIVKAFQANANLPYIRKACAEVARKKISFTSPESCTPMQQ